MGPARRSVFAHRAGMITKAEVRAAALGQLALPRRCAVGRRRRQRLGGRGVRPLLAPGLRVFAVERDPDDAARIRGQRRPTGRRRRGRRGRGAGRARPAARPDRVFVGGGGLAVLDAVLARLRPRRRVVATFAALDRAVAAHARLGHLVQVAVSARPTPARRRRAPGGRQPGVRGLGSGGRRVSGSAVPGDVLTVTLTEAGRALAARLPYQHRHGALAGDRAGRVGTGRRLRAVPRWAWPSGSWRRCSATSTATRPWCASTTPGRWAVPLRAVTPAAPTSSPARWPALLGAEAVLTTATDAAGLPALDQLPGFAAAGDVAGVTRRLLDGAPADPANGAGLAAAGPAGLPGRAGRAATAPTDRTNRTTDGDVARSSWSSPTGPAPRCGHRPCCTRPAWSLGVGSARGASAAEVRRAARRQRWPVPASAPASVGAGGHARPQGDRARHRRPGPGARPAAAYVHRRRPGPPGRCPPQRRGRRRRRHAQRGRGRRPAAAPAPARQLVVAKRRSAMATVAVARRAGPEGQLAVVGLGPGDAAHRTPAASRRASGRRRS